ncbi:hypothetical protein M0812_16892 [Anaeramoeba flamelloides]|uniref:Uncharacterized protein n=1 Tax=Anaeramoeba flamelloides TaxID=1746091 RepID=A0AAV7ZCG7_9EUKA|nr:hypothetical protein M0812_16892 [Anaeramoeba flamelloides]
MDLVCQFWNKKNLARLYRSLVKHDKNVAEKSLWPAITRISTVANFLSMGKGCAFSTTIRSNVCVRSTIPHYFGSIKW